MRDGADNPFMQRIHGPTFPESEVRRDLLAREFLQERCLFQQDYRQPFRALGQEWESWLMVQGAPSIWRRALSQAWLKDRLETRLGYRLMLLNGRHQVVGLLLRAEVEDDVPALPNDATWSALRAASPEIAVVIPLQGATATRRPPDAEILRRFLDECCFVKEKPVGDDDFVRSYRQAHGSLPTRWQRYQRWGRDAFTRITTAFDLWLEEQQVAPSLRRLCTSRWLRHQLTLRGHEFSIVDGGYTAVYGIRLRPDPIRWPDGPPERWRHIRKDAAGNILPRHLRLNSAERRARSDAYWGRLEQQARADAGMPVDEEAYTDSSPADDPGEERKAVLRAQAVAYLDDVLLHVPDEPEASLSLHDLKQGFAGHLLNQSISDLWSDVTLRDELARRGISAVNRDQKRLRTLVGYRFRTPDD